LAIAAFSAGIPKAIPSPSASARCSHSCADSGTLNIRWNGCNCARDPCAACRTGRDMHGNRRKTFILSWPFLSLACSHGFKTHRSLASDLARIFQTSAGAVFFLQWKDGRLVDVKPRHYTGSHAKIAPRHCRSWLAITPVPMPAMPGGKYTVLNVIRLLAGYFFCSVSFGSVTKPSLLIAAGLCSGHYLRYHFIAGRFVGDANCNSGSGFYLRSGAQRAPPGLFDRPGCHPRRSHPAH